MNISSRSIWRLLIVGGLVSASLAPTTVGAALVDEALIASESETSNGFDVEDDEFISTEASSASESQAGYLPAPSSTHWPKHHWPHRRLLDWTYVVSGHRHDNHGYFQGTFHIILNELVGPPHEGRCDGIYMSNGTIVVETNGKLAAVTPPNFLGDQFVIYDSVVYPGLKFAFHIGGKSLPSVWIRPNPNSNWEPMGKAVIKKHRPREITTY